MNEKKLNITNHQRNANQRQKDILPHTCHSDYHQKEHKKQMLGRMWSKGNPLTLLVRM